MEENEVTVHQSVRRTVMADVAKKTIGLAVFVILMAGLRSLISWMLPGVDTGVPEFRTDFLLQGAWPSFSLLYEAIPWLTVCSVALMAGFVWGTWNERLRPPAPRDV